MNDNDQLRSNIFDPLVKKEEYLEFGDNIDHSNWTKQSSIHKSVEDNADAKDTLTMADTKTRDLILDQNSTGSIASSALISIQ